MINLPVAVLHPLIMYITKSFKDRCKEQENMGTKHNPVIVCLINPLPTYDFVDLSDQVLKDFRCET